MPGLPGAAWSSTPGPERARRQASGSRRESVLREAFQDLLNGQVDAVIADNPLALGYIGQNAGKLKTAGDVFTDEFYGKSRFWVIPVDTVRAAQKYGIIDQVIAKRDKEKS